MSKVDIWMPIYIGDYLRDTQDLTLEEHGAYMLLMMHYWMREGNIGNDVSRIARACRADEKTCGFILGFFFETDGLSYRHKRIDEELEKAHNRRESASENGKKGGRPPLNNPQKTHGLSVGKPTKNPDHNPQKSSSSSSSSSKDIYISNTITAKAVSDPLYAEIKQHFEKAQPQCRFTNYPKEGKAIKGLIEKARAREPDHPDIFLHGMIQTFHDLRLRDKFYKGQPYLPSALNASGIWDRVLNEAHERWKGEQAAMEYDPVEVPL